MLLRAAFVVGVALAAWAWFLRGRWIRFEVSGESMLPALRRGDYLVVDRQAYRKRRPRPGDVVIVSDPRKPVRPLAKRLAQYEPALGLWVLGDNDAASTDSRHFGWVDPEMVVGKVVCRYWPSPGRIR